MKHLSWVVSSVVGLCLSLAAPMVSIGAASTRAINANTSRQAAGHQTVGLQIAAQSSNGSQQLSSAGPKHKDDDEGETEKCKGNSGKQQDDGCPPKKCGDDDKGKGEKNCKKHESGDDD